MTEPKPLDWDVILDRLSAFYHRGDWRVPYLRDHAENPFQVLIGTILSQRTRDVNTDRASALLFAKYPGPKELATASLPSLEKLVHSTGYYKTKARHIRATARAILDKFGGTVPADRDELLTLPGVGPKTANCVLVFGYGLPAVPGRYPCPPHRQPPGALPDQDSRTDRGRDRSEGPVAGTWIPLNPLLVQHGQNICRPNRPLCDRCPILEYCATGVALREGRAPPRKEDRPGPPRSRNGRGTPASPRERPRPPAQSSPRR